MKYLTSVVLAGALAGPGVHTATAQPTPLSAERVADLTQLQEWVVREQSFTLENRQVAASRIQTLLNGPEPRSDAEFFLQVASITALADNAHSNTSFIGAYRLGLVPIRPFWFSDGLYIVRADLEHARLLGARIDSIEGVAVDDLLTRLGEYHGGPVEHLRQLFSIAFMLSPPVLHATGIGGNADRLEFALEFSNGTREHVEITAGPWPEKGEVRQWLTLMAEPIYDEGSDWVNLAATRNQPFALQEAEELFRYRYMSDDRVAYVQLRWNRSPEGTVLDDFIASVRTRIADDEPRAIVLDNRYNHGGNLARTGAFALDLPAMVPENGTVYVLTSNQTFSAGIYTSFFPKSADPAKTLVVGTRVGDRERFWAEGGSVSLTNSRIRISFSRQLHDLGEGCHDVGVCHMMNYRDRWNLRVGSLDPDVEIGFTFDDFVSGRDPVMNYVMHLVRER